MPISGRQLQFLVQPTEGSKGVCESACFRGGLTLGCMVHNPEAESPGFCWGLHLLPESLHRGLCMRIPEGSSGWASRLGSPGQRTGA